MFHSAFATGPRLQKFRFLLDRHFIRFATRARGITKHLARPAFATVTESALGSLSSVALSSDSAFGIVIALQPVCKAKNSDKKNLRRSRFPS